MRFVNKSIIAKRLEAYPLTAFQKAVLIETSKISKGETRTYGQIARLIGRPCAYRAVGTALRKNPLAPTIPCHRVIKSNGEVGNYSAPGGTKRKLELLREEKAVL